MPPSTASPPHAAASFTPQSNPPSAAPTPKYPASGPTPGPTPRPQHLPYNPNHHPQAHPHHPHQQGPGGQGQGQGQGPRRADSYPPNTPSGLSHASPIVPSISAAPSAAPSPVTATVKRPLAPATDGPRGGAAGAAADRKPVDPRAQSVVDPSTGKKKRISLSCAQCEYRQFLCLPPLLFLSPSSSPSPSPSSSESLPPSSSSTLSSSFSFIYRQNFLATGGIPDRSAVSLYC